MVNYSDPKTVAADYAAMLKLHHVVDGIFLWEFLTTLDYEWDVFRGRRPYLKSIWIYSVTRLATLLTIILNLVSYNITRPIICQAWATWVVIFPCIVFGSASLLIILRIIAIWNSEKYVIIIATCVWMADVVVFIVGIARLRAGWSDEDAACIMLNPESNKPTIFSSLVTDIVLLLIMLMGLLRSRIGKGGAGRILRNQGLVWLFLATVAEVPSTVFMCLNLNRPLNYIFQAVPNVVIMSIVATAMYRSLVNYGSSDFQSSAFDSNNFLKSKRAGSTRVPSAPIPLSRLEFVRGTEVDQCPTSGLPQCDVVKSELPTEVQPGKISYTLV